MSLIRSMRCGKDYDANWNTRMTGTGPYAQMIARRFQMAVKRYGLNQERRPLTVAKFRRPPKTGDQLSLFETTTPSWPATAGHPADDVATGKNQGGNQSFNSIRA